MVGGGKAGLGMALGIERLLGRRITDGLVNIPNYRQRQEKAGKVRFNLAGHPVPSEQGVRGVRKMLQLVGKPSPRDLVICLVSGGGSALLPLPAAGLTLGDEQEATRILLESGASIREVNTVRRHLSQIKGGRLAERFSPATILSLIISDVTGDTLEDIGSGPTAPDPSTFADARRILERHRVWRKVPKAVRETIRKGTAGLVKETPKPGSRIFRRVHNVVVGDNRRPCLAVADVLRKRGYRTLILTRRLEGEARQVGKVLASIFSDLNQGQFFLKSPLALVAGGETTVSVIGNGIGGRNQELVLAASLGIQGLPNVMVASIGTDGFDGPTDAAGAIADGSTVGRARKIGLDPQKFLENNDSYSFFKGLNDLIETGPTGTNVADITLALAGPWSKTAYRSLPVDR